MSLKEREIECVSYGINPKIEIRTTESEGKGLGYFASEDIKEGELIADWTKDGTKYDHPLAEILSWPQNRRRKFFKKSYQVDDEIYNGFHSDTEISEKDKLFWCLNHSCDGNVWYVKKDYIVARRDIQKGEELGYDYCTTQANPVMNMKCLCAAKNCRGFIKGDDWKNKELQERYEGHFLPYIANKIQQQHHK